MRVMTLGTFDLFHPGHLDLLLNCRMKSYPEGPSEVIVGLNTDEFVEKYKGSVPIMRYEERATMLRICKYVDLVVPNPRFGSQAAGIAHVKPRLILVGSDWATRDYLGQLGVDQSFLDRHGIRVIYVQRPNPPLISSTKIRERVLEYHGSTDRLRGTRTNGV